MNVRRRIRVLIAALVLGTPACGSDPSPAGPTPQPAATTATVRIVFAGPTARRTDLPPSAQPCVDGVGPTHIHPSWRSFAAIPLQAFPPNRYELTFNDVPFDTRVSFRVNDQNACDENPTGAVTRNIFANDVRLTQNTTTPGNGDEPGFAFTISRSGTISQ